MVVVVAAAVGAVVDVKTVGGMGWSFCYYWHFFHQRGLNSAVAAHEGVVEKIALKSC